MAFNTKIIERFKSSMQLEEIAIKDTESDDQPDVASEESAKPSKAVGHIAPYVKINGYVFDHNDIEDMTLSEQGFLPSINITIRDTKGVFSSAYFPKTNPVLSLYIRSINDKLKCIRCDFLIIDISSDESQDSEDTMAGKNISLTMSGILLVPNLFDNTPQSYASMTSLEVLQELAFDMKLGFATNEDYTNDNMTWIKPLIRRNTFIQNVITYSFKDDKSFYWGFVSKHYHLTFVNMSEMFKEDLDFDKMYEKVITYADLYEKQSDATVDNSTTDLILTNALRMAHTDSYITSFVPETNNGSILVNSGYIRNLGYYDTRLTDDYRKNFVELDVKPISETLAPGKNRPGERIPDENLDNLATNANGEWCGVDYNNGHDNFNFARVQNEHNNNDVRKITLNISMDGINLNLLRGMRVPVLIIRENPGDMVMMDAQLTTKDELKSGTEKSEEKYVSVDKWLSGYYVVGSLKYNYDARGKKAFTTDAVLYRMNWNQPNATQPEKNTK